MRISSPLPSFRRRHRLAGYEKVCSTAEVPTGEKKYFNVKGKEIVLINVEGKFYAIHNWCSHEQGDLSAGTLKGYVLKCPEHGAEFDVRSGKVLLGPDDGDPSSIEHASAFETSVRGDDVYVKF
jgi:nitrite reductase/ring-hydroxylating ferredoxin subunit